MLKIEYNGVIIGNKFKTNLWTIVLYFKKVVMFFDEWKFVP